MADLADHGRLILKRYDKGVKGVNNLEIEPDPMGEGWMWSIHRLG
ncbi:hypothetical protein [Terriglobus sp. TAA 43]|nr:hypothetical protein [Terriglobus sp. TAA 43]